MNTLAALPHSPSSRYVGIGFVVALHVLAVIAISNGLMHKTVPPPPRTEVVIIPDLVTPPPPLQPPPRLQPNLATADPLPVPAPEVAIAAPQPTTTIVTQAIDTAVPPLSTSNWTAPTAPTQASTTPQPAGAVCTKMPAPEVPTLNWSGEALFRVVAGTQAGRVNSVAIQAVRGGMDARTLRTVKAAIERTLREGYECPGNVQFTQEFQFRIE